MKIIECIVCPSKVAVIQRSLKGYGVSGMTLTSVLTCGSQKGITEFNIEAVVRIRSFECGNRAI